MIFFLINRFRRKKLRARESRQTAEDQRSIVGSIGYIAGNMGYMEGNLSSMDYTYGGAATHYPLWKPPSGYFPRGEAPPPYDEAVAISQAEALSAQCAAAAAAQVAATQRATMGLNTVELQNADLNRRTQVNQQMQHHNQPQTTHSQLSHQPTHGVPTIQAHVLAPQNQQNTQTHQITQSTTNLINININSGGNITTIATGENHQPPYSLQDENGASTGIIQQQSSTLANQQIQMQQQQQQLIAAATNGSNGQSNGRVHLAQSNSICVQTMAPLNPPQSQQQQQLSSTQNCGVQSSQIVTTNTNNLSRPTQNDCGYKNCHLNINNSTNTLSRRLQRSTNEPLQQYVLDVEVNVGNANNRGFSSLPPCNNTQITDVEAIASPTQFSNNSASMASDISSPAVDQLSLNSSLNQPSEGTNSIHISENCTQLNIVGHNTLPLQHIQTNKSAVNSNGNIKSSSSSSSSNSSKRYHRTMPRYYAVADPLSMREGAVTSNALNNVNKSSKTDTKLNTNINNSSAISSSLTSSKKPTCQCPVQHVPMSYMGSTQLNNAQNVTNNAFFTVLSNKLSASASSSPTASQHSQRLQMHSNTNSLNYQQRPKSSQSLNHSTRDTENISSTNTTMKRSLNTHCNYDTKIATISTGELHNSTANAQSQHSSQQQHHHHSHGHAHHHSHHSSLLPPPQHHDDLSPIVLGRVTKRSSSSSSGERLRSTSSGSARSSVAESVGVTSPAAAAYLNSKVDAYLNFAHGTNHHLKANDLINPALPPKLHKSLTNLKTTTSTTATATSSASTNTYNQRKNHQNEENATTTSNNTYNSNTTSTNCNNVSSLTSSSASVNTAMANTTSVQTIYTLSKPHHISITSSSASSSSSTNTTSTTIGLSPSFHTASSNLFQQTRKTDHDHIIKITQQPPSLTLPLSTTSTISSFTSSTSKINSSTFYPLQNNVTYTLPKNTGGKMSLNSTINSVVSKVPSVISLPLTTSGHDNFNTNNTVGNVSLVGENHNNYNSSLHHHHSVNDAAPIISKSTTLPKILRTKRELHNATLNNNSHLNFTATNNHTLTNNSPSSNFNSSTNYAVSQCSMPAYPKQYTSASLSTVTSASAVSAATSTSSTKSKSHSHYAATSTTSQSQPTNINMQTQTITSTLAANYCPEDSHLNPHHLTATNNTITAHHSSSNNSKQLPVCTTSKNCLNPKEHFLPNDTSLDDDYLSECENCKIAQSSKYYLDAETLASGPQETMTLQRKSMEECKEEPETGYYRISHTLPTNSKKNAPVKSNNRNQWFSTIPAASSSSEEDINE